MKAYINRNYKSLEDLEKEAAILRGAARLAGKGIEAVVRTGAKGSKGVGKGFQAVKSTVKKTTGTVGAKTKEFGKGIKQEVEIGRGLKQKTNILGKNKVTLTAKGQQVKKQRAIVKNKKQQAKAEKKTTKELNAPSGKEKFINQAMGAAAIGIPTYYGIKGVSSLMSPPSQAYTGGSVFNRYNPMGANQY